MVGTDSTFLGEKPSPRTYGSFPRILGQFVRDEAAPVARGGGAQDDRRPPRASACASAACCATAMRPTWSSSTRARPRNATYDEPRQFPDGIDYVIVNGELVVDGGHHRRSRGALRLGRS